MKKIFLLVLFIPNFILAQSFVPNAPELDLKSYILIEPNTDTYFDYCKLDKDWVKNVSDSLVRIPKAHESASYWLDKAYKLKYACEKFNLPLKQAAIQFPYSNKIVTSCLLGMTSQNQVEENISLYNKKIDNKYWEYLKENELISSKSPI